MTIDIKDISVTDNGILIGNDGANIRQYTTATSIVAFMIFGIGQITKYAARHELLYTVIAAVFTSTWLLICFRFFLQSFRFNYRFSEISKIVLTNHARYVKLKIYLKSSRYREVRVKDDISSVQGFLSRLPGILYNIKP